MKQPREDRFALYELSNPYFSKKYRVPFTLFEINVVRSREVEPRPRNRKSQVRCPGAGVNLGTIHWPIDTFGASSYKCRMDRARVLTSVEWIGREFLQV